MAGIDAHTHLFPPAQIRSRAGIAERDPGFAEIYADPRAGMAEAGDLEDALADAGLEGAVVAGFAFAAERDLAEQAEYLASAAGASDGRLRALAPVNPALPGWESAARSALAAGARGFGELRPETQGWDPCGPAGRKLCALAAEAGAVLLWHVSEPAGHAYPGKAGGIAPGELIAAATAFPAVPMIGAHLGGGASFYLQMPEVRSACPNLHFDTAAVSLLYDHDAIRRLVEVAGDDRVLFGSDFPLRAPRGELERTVAGLPAPAVRAITRANAARLFPVRR